MQELADRLAAELVGGSRRSDDGTVEGLLVVPLQREADVTAVVKVVRVDARCAVSQDRPGRHRAEESSDEDRDRGDDDRDDDERDRDRDQDDGDQDDGDQDDGDQDDGDEDDRDDDDGDRDDVRSSPSTAGAGHPAMAVLVTSGDDPSGRYQARHIDPGAMLSALGDLQCDDAA